MGERKRSNPGVSGFPDTVGWNLVDLVGKAKELRSNPPDILAAFAGEHVAYQHFQTEKRPLYRRLPSSDRRLHL